MMNTHNIFRFSLMALVMIFCGNSAPVDQKTTTNKPSDTQNEDAGEQMAYNLEYERYLQEVVQLLESDPDFRAKLEKADAKDIKSGKIAEELDFLHHGVRSKLNEIKRRELDRLRDALREKAERENGIHELVVPGHINHQGETFEKEDLRKLVIQATKDLEILDKKREQDYKEYEMKKELEFRQKLVNMTEEERQNAIRQRNETEKKHGQHPDVIHPGSENQLKEVWEDVDKLPKEEFNPETFFQLHDYTGDGILDAGELEALFQRELDKVYDKANPEDDMRQRDEEMARMRQHVMQEWDQNKDGLISRDEFLAGTRREDFKRDQGWDTLEKKKIYSEDDLKAFAEQWARMNGLPAQALYPPYGGYPYPYPYQPYPNQLQQQQPYYGGPPQMQNQFAQGGPPYQQYPPHPAVQQQQWAQQQQWQQQQQQQQWGQQQFQPQGYANIPNQQPPVNQAQQHPPPNVVDPNVPNQHVSGGQVQQQVPPMQNVPPPVQDHQLPVQQHPPPAQPQQPQVPVAQGQQVQNNLAQAQQQAPPPPQQPVGQQQHPPAGQQHQPLGDIASNQVAGKAPDSAPAQQGNPVPNQRLQEV